MKIIKVATKDFLNISDLSQREILGIFELAGRLKKSTRKKKYHNFLQRKSLAMIFEKSSTRTRVSFETGITQLGGHALFLSETDIQLGRGETTVDTARVLSRYVDGIMIRTFSQDKIVELARNSTVPVINGLSDQYHPCQAMADYFTIYEISGTLSGRKVTYIGDGNNVANSLLLGGAILGADITVACPDAFRPHQDVIEKSAALAETSGGKVTVTPDIDESLKGTEYLYTDVWISMGQEKDKAVQEKMNTLSSYRVTSEILKKCGPACRIMHCLPAHRGEEIDADVLESEHSIVFEQAENRLHVQKAIMCALMRS